MRHAVRHFCAVGCGILVSVSSRSAQRGTGNPDAIAYAASKAAIEAAAQSIARGYAQQNVLSYIVAPGLVDTAMSAALMVTGGGAPMVNSGLPMGELIPAEEIAEIVTFLTAGMVWHLSGATIDVNGASYMR